MSDTTNTDPYSGGELPADADLAPAPDDVKDDDPADEVEELLPQGVRADREEPLP